MNNFLAILEFCAFCMEYKNPKFTGINFRGRTNVEYSMQIQHLRFYKDTAKVFFSLLKITTKSTHFLPAKKKIEYCGLNFKQIKHKRSQNLTYKHRRVVKKW